MKAKLIRWLAEWLYRNHRFLLEEIVVGHNKHIHANPKKRVTLMVDFPEPMEEGIFYPTKEVSDV